MKSRISLILPALFLTMTMFAQGPEGDWYYVDPGQDGTNGIGLNSLYQTLPANTQPREIVVAILDSGVDLDHEDLMDNIWVNLDEIPGNGIDDDGNGYVDDIHGWNFLGGPDGGMVTGETLEVTRLYKKYMEYFEGKDVDNLSKKDQKLYAAYEEYKRTVEKERGKAKKGVSEMESQEQMLMEALDAFAKKYPNQVITDDFIENFDPGTDQNMIIAQQMLMQAKAYGMEFEDIAVLREEIKSGYEEAKKDAEHKLAYHYNPELDNRRDVIKDNYSDPYESSYGNSDVGGTFSFHGTHVAGIVGAVKDNDIGSRGIATNVKLMILRVVPNGDEHDKDIANAIKYAADNGASVINMSFGKGYSPYKKAVDKAVKYARKKDVLMVHAAGNAAENNDEITHFPVPKYEKPGLFGKKEADNWIEVGALSPNHDESAVAPFSNYGAETVDLFAPGMMIYSTAPDDTYRPANGTSMAAPVVSGVAALIRSYYPGLTAQQVKELLVTTVDKPSFKVRHPETDEMVNFSDLCRSQGIIDAQEAFKRAASIKGKKKVKDTETPVAKA